MAYLQSETGAKFIRNFFGSGGKLAEEVLEKMQGYDDNAKANRTFGEFVTRTSKSDLELKQRRLDAFTSKMERLLNLADQRLQQDKNYNETEQARVEREEKQIQNVRAKLLNWKREKNAALSVQRSSNK
jgi:predicted RNA-binding protein with RPS1 domain